MLPSLKAKYRLFYGLMILKSRGL